MSDTGSRWRVERRLNPAWEMAVVLFVSGMMLMALTGFARS
jgi:hypothetical protein